MSMKFSSVILTIVMAGFLVSNSLAFVWLPRTQNLAAHPEGAPVVIELFTSEGCSDCPPADALLQRMEQQPVPGVKIIPLEEHVDYWNQLGWTDPYSSSEWTMRQREYVAKTRSNVSYTPEMVVDGESQFVGGDERDVWLAVGKAAREPKTFVAISPEKSDFGNVESFRVSVGELVGNTPGDTAEIWLAVAEDGLRSTVTAGENVGKALSHAAVVRSLRKVGVADAAGEPMSFTGDSQLKFHSGWKRENLHVVVFVQERKSLRILGAASVEATN